LNRRLFLAAGALCLIAARKKKPVRAPAITSANNVFAPYEGSSASRLPPTRAAEFPANWRHFDLALTLKAETSRGDAKFWFPLPLHQDTPTQPWQRVERLRWESGARVLLERQPDDGVEALVGDWGTSGRSSQLRLEASLAIAERRLNISRRSFAPEREDILRGNLTATRLLPVNDVAKNLAQGIVGRIVDPLAQAHALYDWVVEKSVFDIALPDNDGDGDIWRQIETKRYGGGAADICGLFVLLARAIGIPARRVFGFFVAPSQLSPALGADFGQSELPLRLHCRAEFYTPGYHWIPVDPAGVCRAATLDQGIVNSTNALNALKRLTFGFWETNWLALNYVEGEALGNLPRFSPQADYSCQVVSQETRTSQAP
jgi:transglutaminase-like putative cysteine protease